MPYFQSSKDVVQFVDGTIPHFESGSPLTMIIGRSKSGDYFASIVIATSLGDIVKQVEPSSLKQLTRISPTNTPAG